MASKTIKLNKDTQKEKEKYKYNNNNNKKRCIEVF